jgi:mono/diheme cytochrome c family protein
MQKKIVTILLSMFFISPAFASTDGKTLYKTLCSSCHVPEGQPTLAPPLFGMKNHVMGRYPAREDFINYVVNWVKKPDASRSLMPGAVNRFGVMPAFPYEEDQVRAIAAFIYDSDLTMPGWYQQHYQQQHGKPPTNSQ